MSIPSFFTNEAVSLERQIYLTKNLLQSKLENIDSQYEIYRCGDWIKSNNFQKVTIISQVHFKSKSNVLKMF